MTETEINAVGNALIAMVNELGVRQKCIIAGKAGIQVGAVPSEHQNMFVDSSIRKGFADLDMGGQLKALPILAEQLIGRYDTARTEETVRLWAAWFSIH